MVKPKIKKPTVALIKEQKDVKRGIMNNAVSFIEGKAGTSKTFTVVATALDLLFKKEIDKIIISRPTKEAGESMGFLPGDLGAKEGKLAPFLVPVFATFEKIIGTDGKQIVDQMIETGVIEVVPPQYLRGWNFEHSFVIIDEAQNLTTPQLNLILSRLCKTAKMALTVDDGQIDLVPAEISCYSKLYKIKEVEDVFFGELTTNHRHPLAIKLIDIIQDETKEL